MEHRKDLFIDGCVEGSLDLTSTCEIIDLIKHLEVNVVELSLGHAPIINGKLICVDDHRGVRPVGLEYMENANSEIILSCTNRVENKWGIFDGSFYCLSKSGKWEYNTRCRTEEFLNSIRWDSAKEAVDFYKEWKAKVVKKHLDKHGELLQE